MRQSRLGCGQEKVSGTFSPAASAGGALYADEEKVPDTFSGPWILIDPFRQVKCRGVAHPAVSK
jgi:hypothetical protein